jgi:hypothetical protein
MFILGLIISVVIFATGFVAGSLGKQYLGWPTWPMKKKSGG